METHIARPALAKVIACYCVRQSAVSSTAYSRTLAAERTSARASFSAACTIRRAACWPSRAGSGAYLSRGRGARRHARGPAGQEPPTHRSSRQWIPRSSGRAPTAWRGRRTGPHLATSHGAQMRDVPRGQAGHDAGWSSVDSTIPRLHSCAERHGPGQDNARLGVLRQPDARCCAGGKPWPRSQLCGRTPARCSSCPCRPSMPATERSSPPRHCSRKLRMKWRRTSPGTPGPSHRSRTKACVRKNASD